jgi:hypothetical protein
VERWAAPFAVQSPPMELPLILSGRRNAARANEIHVSGREPQSLAPATSNIINDDRNRLTAVLFKNSGGTLQKTVDDTYDWLIYESV